MVRPQPHQGATLRPTAHTVRIWDLPNRLLHWRLAACPIALAVSAKLGGNAMEWHLRLGHSAGTRAGANTWRRLPCMRGCAAPLIGLMLHGDQQRDPSLPASRDTATTRLLASVVLALCAASA